MAGVTRAGGHPDYSSTGTNRFISQIWSGKLVRNLYEATCLSEIANTEYEGEIKGYGDTVIIRTIPEVAIGDYTIGGGLTYGKPESPALELPINRAKSYALQVNDVDKMQSDIALMDEWSKDAGQRLKIAQERDIFSTAYTQVAAQNAGATAGKISGNINLGVTATPRAVDKTNIIDYIVDLALVLDEQNVPDEDRWLVLPARACAAIKKSDLKDASVTGDNQSLLRNGRLGIIDRFQIYRSNTLSVAAGKFNVMFGHKMALTYATQITKAETLKNPNDFGDLVRGLMVYGSKVEKPQAMGHSVATFA